MPVLGHLGRGQVNQTHAGGDILAQQELIGEGIGGANEILGLKAHSLAFSLQKPAALELVRTADEGEAAQVLDADGVPCGEGMVKVDNEADFTVEEQVGLGRAGGETDFGQTLVHLFLRRIVGELFGMQRDQGILSFEIAQKVSAQGGDGAGGIGGGDVLFGVV